jgi:flagellar basal body rod protein FlgC
MTKVNNKSATLLRAQRIRVHTITSNVAKDNVDKMQENNNPQKQVSFIKESNKSNMILTSQSDEADFIEIQVAKIVARKGLNI